jgi:hypothetical protein
MQHTTVKEICDKLMRYPSMRDLSYESAIGWTADVMGLVGSYDLYKDERDIVIIENNKGKLPENIVRVDQCRKIQSQTPYPTYAPMRVATDTFHIAYENYPSNYTGSVSTPTYKIQSDVIFTSFSTGLIEIAYKCLYTDEDGIPMIPAGSSMEKAVEAYIKQEHFRGLFEIEKISRAVFDKAEQEYCWYIAQAQNSVMNVSQDERQSISNSIHKLIWNDDFHRDGFRNLGDQEQLRNIRG